MDLSLKIINVRKKFNGKAALQECSYEFARGGVFALMGPNGSGKSTLLRSCALLEPVDGGDIIYASGGNVLPHNLGLRRRITLVLPRVGIFNTTVFKNAAYGLSLRGEAKESIRKKAGAALEAVGLLPKAQQNALTLSSGETQRLGIARAMAIEPEILFLDEPTASIDEKNTTIIEKIILDLKHQGNTTVIMTTHDREQAVRVADTVVMMREGRILKVAGS
jgi:tungstate transport system ATP-binding protein